MTRVSSQSRFCKISEPLFDKPSLFASGLWSRKSRHPTPTPTPGNFDYPTPTPTPTPTPGRLRPSAVLVT